MIYCNTTICVCVHIYIYIYIYVHTYHVTQVFVSATMQACFYTLCESVCCIIDMHLMFDRFVFPPITLHDACYIFKCLHRIILSILYLVSSGCSPAWLWYQMSNRHCLASMLLCTHLMQGNASSGAVAAAV